MRPLSICEAHRPEDTGAFPPALGSSSPKIWACCAPLKRSWTGWTFTGWTAVQAMC